MDRSGVAVRGHLVLRTLPYDALVGVLIGAVTSGAISWYFYQRASDELRIEAEKLRHVNDTALRMLQTMSGGGKVAVRQDEQGEPVGAAHHIGIADSVDATDSAQPSHTSDKDRDPEP